MTSGNRYDPPISMSSPLATGTALPDDVAARARSRAAALLLTMSESSAPVRPLRSREAYSPLLLLSPVSTSISTLVGLAAASAAAATASFDHRARPRLVCRSTPVALMIGTPARRLRMRIMRVTSPWTSGWRPSPIAFLADSKAPRTMSRRSSPGRAPEYSAARSSTRGKSRYGLAVVTTQVCQVSSDRFIRCSGGCSSGDR